MAASLYDLAVGGTEMDPAERKRVADEIQARLNKDKSAGMLMALTGSGRGIGKMGERMYSNANKETDDLRKFLSDQLDAQSEAGRQRQEDAWRRQQAEALAKYRADTLAARNANRSASGLTPYQEASLEAQAQNRHDTRTGQLSQRMQQAGVPGLETSATVAEGYLQPYMQGGDIPGIGPVENMLPDFARGDEAQMVRSSVQGVANQLLKLRSGAAVTDPEMRRFLTEVALGKGVSENVFRQRWPQVMDIIRAEKDNIMAGFPEDVQATYLSRFSDNATKAYTQPEPNPRQGTITRTDGQTTQTAQPSGVTHRFNPQTGQVEEVR